jgi:hypothetical protein
MQRATEPRMHGRSVLKRIFYLLLARFGLLLRRLTQPSLINFILN